MKKFTPQQYAEAQKYWKNLTKTEQVNYWKHYTTGEGAGIINGVEADTSFEDFNVISMIETELDILYDR